ncbi:MAG: hypothetical protein IKT56_02715 [Clostridia bacterium]|nr:hypothetical protein [Clostridia bacterium]
MSKEKQIEEMARIASKCITSWLNNETPKALPDYIAEAFCNADYRKQSENTIELPCKVGTTLYFLYNSPYADKPDLTPRILKTDDWYFEIDKIGIVINTSDIHSFNKNYDYYLGETVFLTKKEAEEALANMKGEGKEDEGK